MNSVILYVLASLLMAAVGLAQNSIEGAFGMRLGQEFQGNLRMDDAATTRVPFTPEKTFQGLTEYSVDLSAKTHRVCSINAVGPAADEDDAWRLMTLLSIILQEKYRSNAIAEGQTDTGDQRTKVRRIYPISSSPEQAIRISQGERAIHIEIYPNRTPPPPTNTQGIKPARLHVGVRYTDNALNAEATKEIELIRAEAKAKEMAEIEAREKAAQEALEAKRKETESRRSELRKQIELDAKRVDSSGL